MTDEEIKTKASSKDNSNEPNDLEFEHYLFEVYLNDRIENEIQRMMEFSYSIDKSESNPNNHEL